MCVMTSAIASDKCAFPAHHPDDMDKSESNKTLSDEGKRLASSTPDHTGEPSTLRSICLIATCSASMVVNVRLDLLSNCSLRLTHTFRSQMLRVYLCLCLISV